MFISIHATNSINLTKRHYWRSLYSGEMTRCSLKKEKEDVFAAEENVSEDFCFCRKIEA